MSRWRKSHQEVQVLDLPCRLPEAGDLFAQLIGVEVTEALDHRYV